jgi:hypothetical protein
LYAVCVFSVHADLTRDNIGWIIGLPMRLAEQIFGQVTKIDQGTIGGAVRYTGYHILNLVWVYLIAVLIRRETPGTEAEAEAPVDQHAV